MTTLRRRVLTFTLLGLCLGQGLGAQSRPGFLGRWARSGQEAPGDRRAPASDALLLRRHTAKDPKAGNIAAFSLLVPQGWKVDAQVLWDLRWCNLAQPWVRAASPDGSVTVETLPVIPFVWSEVTAGMMPVGSNWLGAELRRPILEPRAFVENIVIPRQRQDLQRARAAQTVEMPDVAEAVRAQLRQPGIDHIEVRAARVRYAYVAQGAQVEEDLYVVVCALHSRMGPGLAMWGPTGILSVRAPAGQLDRCEGLARAMGDSLRFEPLWHGQYHEVCRMWREGHRAQIESAGRISRIISKTNDEILAIHRSTWEERQRSQDRVADSFSRYIRGIERYADPVAGRSVSLPSGYDHVWVSSTGDYALSNDAGYDPNRGGAHDWRRMQVAAPGR